MKNEKKQQLEKLALIKRKAHHPLIHEVHKQHGISKKTLFYVKEYGKHANVPKTIIKESIKILLLASVLSSIGGLALEFTKMLFISLIPIIILLPALNDLIGDYGMILSSRFSTMLYEGKITKTGWKNKELKKLFYQVSLISILTALISSAIALIISSISGFQLDFSIAFKIFLIAVIDALLLVNILFLISTIAGIYFFKKQEDPNNFLIPITTSIADFGNMLILAVLVIMFF